jgi:hypothetical protein
MDRIIIIIIICIILSEIAWLVDARKKKYTSLCTFFKIQNTFSVNINYTNKRYYSYKLLCTFIYKKTYLALK